MGQPGIDIGKPVIPFQPFRSRRVNIEICGKTGQDRRIGGHVFINGIALGAGIRPIGKDKIADVIIESVELEADIRSAVAICRIDLIALLLLQVDITQLEGVGADVQAVARELINSRGPKAFGDIELDILTMWQLVRGADASGPARIRIVEGGEPIQSITDEVGDIIA